MRLFALCLMTMTALPALAQDQAPEDQRYIPLAEWRERAIGNSVHYTFEGRYIGREYYLPDGRSVRFEDAAGNCQEGWWTFKDEVYCFAWPGDLVCARHVDLGQGRLSFPSVESDGTEIPNETQDGVLVEGGFACSPGLVS